MKSRSTLCFAVLLGLILSQPSIAGKKPKEDKPAPAQSKSPTQTQAADPLHLQQPAVENVDLQMMARIRDEGFRRSQVMDLAAGLTDGIGPRLTGSPNMKRANEWTRDKLAEFGLSNAHLEAWGDFGLGWQEQNTWVRMIAPDIAPLIARPMAWTGSTQGTVRGNVIRAVLRSDSDFEKYRGKLKDSIVLLGDMREVAIEDKPLGTRYDDKELDALSEYQIPQQRTRDPAGIVRRRQFQVNLNKFLADEKVLATIEPSFRGSGGTIFVAAGAGYKPGEESTVPQLVMAVENYGRIYRLVQRNVPVQLEMNVETKFFRDDTRAYDTVAEIPGSDLADQVVMLGGHLDSWHTGTGATDNAAGSVVAMEAVRILEALGVKPRRTIRIALWSGEEQGLLGSQGYARQHFGYRNYSNDPREKDLPDYAKTLSGSVVVKSEQAKVSAYFNVDNGSGKLRGVYLQENAAVRPIFEAWIKPFRDLGVTTLTMRNTRGTDHLSFDAVGIPGFQFIQDELEYETRSHHSNMDVYERLQPDDLKQAAVVEAAFVYDAAMRDQMLPRKPLPTAEPPRAAVAEGNRGPEN